MSLAIENLSIEIGERAILGGISFEVPESSIVGLFGPNGAGKSTTFKCISGFLENYRGQIKVDGKDLSSLKIHHRISNGIAFLPQHSVLFWDLSVRENLEVVAQLHPDLKISEEKINLTIEEFSLFKLLDQKASTLSGGERRRLEIARLLLLEPKYILVDEPFSGIDPKTIEELIALIKKLKHNGKGILLTDHNVLLCLDICDSCNIIYEGRVIAGGNPEQIKADPEVQKVFLGETMLRKYG